MPIANDVLARYRGSNEVFIETGTFLGDGVKRALDAGYKRIYSIEINEGLVTHNRAQFAQLPQVTIVHGDSSKDLANLLKEVNTPATFWLDGHFSNNPLTGFNPELVCPVLQELEQIRLHAPNNVPMQSHTILIDDVRLFHETGRKLDGYFQLTIDLVIAKLKEINPNYVLAYEAGVQPNDILTARCG